MRVRIERMGRIIANVKITNLLDPERTLQCDATVDTGSAHMVLPTAWRDRLGKLTSFREIECQTATQETVRAAVCGPVQIQIEGFEPVCGEVLFLDMQPTEWGYEPLLGYLVLEPSQVAVDMLGHRLVRVKTVDLK